MRQVFASQGIYWTFGGDNLYRISRRWSTDGVGDRDGRIHVWSTDAAHRCVTELQSPHKENVLSLAFIGPNRLVVCNREVDLVSFDWNLLPTIERHDNLGWLCDFSVAPDKKLAASLSTRREISLFEISQYGKTNDDLVCRWKFAVFSPDSLTWPLVPKSPVRSGMLGCGSESVSSKDMW